MTNTIKPNEEQDVENKDENVEYNPVNMAGKKSAGGTERDKHNPKEKVLPLSGGDKNAVGNHLYNPVNMAGKKAGGK
jgi:hypothetical protein